MHRDAIVDVAPADWRDVVPESVMPVSVGLPLTLTVIVLEVTPNRDAVTCTLLPVAGQVAAPDEGLAKFTAVGLSLVNVSPSVLPLFVLPSR